MKTTQRIRKQLAAMEDGKILFLSDFADSGNSQAVRAALSRMARSGEIVKLAHGIYQKALYEKEIGLGLIKATNEEIAKAYADQYAIELYLTCEAAKNVIGLTTQNQMNTIYLTNARTRHIKTYRGKGILLIHTDDFKLAKFKSERLRLLHLAFKISTKEELYKNTSLIKKELAKVLQKDLENDLKYFNSWQQELLTSCAQRHS